MRPVQSGGAARHRLPEGTLSLLTSLGAVAFALAVSIFFAVRLGTHFGLVRLVATAHVTQAPRVPLPILLPGAASPKPTPTPPSSSQEAGLAQPAGTQVTHRKVVGTWVPIVMYHYIRVAPAGDRVGFNLSVTPRDFATQLRYLREHGYTTLNMRDLDNVLLSHASLPAKPVVLTFDDGYEDFYTEAAPALRAHGMTATAYIATQLVGRQAYMTWPQIQELDAEGFEMGGHSQFHINLATSDPSRANFEILASKSDLESHLGHRVQDFCYPYGGHNLAVERMVAQAGWLSSTTTEAGGYQDASYMFTLPRVRVGGGESLDTYARLLLPH